MPIPEFYHFIKPALAVHKDGLVYDVNKIESLIIAQFNLSLAEQSELLPSGTMTRLRNRLHWATSYLRQAQLLEKVGRGQTRITPRGSQFLPSAPEPTKPADLMCFPEFAEFQRRGKPSGTGFSKSATLEITEKATPEETISAAYAELRNALAQEILDRIKSMPPAFFERLIVRLMLSLGYGGSAEDTGQTLGKSGDGGIDGVINQDKLGLDKIYLQAKRWNETTVGSKEVQAFVGALVGQGVNKGVFITTSTFSAAALKYRDQNHGFKISLIDGYELARLMIDHNLGVSLIESFDIKRIDSDFFSSDYLLV